MSVRMPSAPKIGLPFLPVPSLYNPQSKGKDANSGHRIKHSVWSQRQAREIGIVSSNQIDKVESHFPAWDAWEREREGIEFGL
jgi:hypothetical protein